MIKVDYTIKRNENDEIKIYHPEKIPTEFQNLVCIKGPNSSGKSTFLNFIALGFYGLKLPNSEIDQSLKEKLQNLLESSHQKVKFQISIDYPDMGFSLISEKADFESKDIIVKKIIGNKEIFLSAESFQSEFRLIYDIPNNPLERLLQLVKDIKTSQSEIGQIISSFRIYLKSLIDEIRESKDPDYISTLVQKYEKLNDEYIILKNGYDITKQFHIRLYNFTLSKLFIQCMREQKELSQKYDSLQHSIDQRERTERRTIRARIIVQKDIENSIERCENAYQESYKLLTQIITKNEKPHYDYWVNSKISDEVYYPEKCRSLRAETTFFIEHIENQILNDKIDLKKDLATIDFYKLLISTLSEPRFNSITVPGVNQTVEIFKNDVAVELRKLEHIEMKFSNLQKCKENLELLKSYLNSAIELIKEKQNSTDDQDEISINSIFAEKKELLLLKNQMIDVDSKFEKYRKKIIDQHLDPHDINEIYEKYLHDDEIKKYEFESEINLVNILKKMDDQLAGDKEKIKKIEETLVLRKNEISIMENKDTHEYRKFLSYLEVYYQKVQALEYKFKTLYQSYLEKVSDPINSMSLSTEQKKYADLLGKFLGSKINTIRHIDQQYEISRINIIDRVFITTNNKNIYFSDLGTGQGQSAFLTAKLSLNDNKKIIALFDEVAMMDENSLLPVRQKIRQLYNDKKLVMAIIVQKNDVMIIEDI